MREDFNWHRARFAARSRGGGFGGAVVAVMALGTVIGLALAMGGPHRGLSLVSGPTAAAGQRVSFGLCHTGGGTNCVVDGDTFWMGGEKIRIADIDTPETHPPRCVEEAERGTRATERLQELLNAGPVTLGSIDRDEDRYGRKLRVVMRDGVSLGDTLIREGLARPWAGRRMSWCGVG